MARSLSSIQKLHLHFRKAGINGSAQRNLSDATCHKLWHRLSNHEGLTDCFYKRPETTHLTTLAISFVVDIDEWTPYMSSFGNFDSRTCIMESEDSTTSCIDIRCPEEEAAQKLLRQDDECSLFYEHLLEHLHNLARGPEPEIQKENDGAGSTSVPSWPGGSEDSAKGHTACHVNYQPDLTTPLWRMKRAQMMANFGGDDIWQPGDGLVERGLDAESVPTRIPI